MKRTWHQSIAYVLLFCTNRKCNIPLHLLLTDLIDAHGGSKELIKILNNFGAIASLETYRHHVQYRIQNRLQHGVTSNFQKDAFTVVSMDNIDFLQSSAIIYCGDQSRSWHGTTVQAVQPFVSEETLAIVHSTMIPTSSLPHKKSKRSRSLSEASSMNQFSFKVSEQNLSLEGNPHPLEHLSDNHYTPLKNKKLSDFHLAIPEGMNILYMQHLFFVYIGIRNAMNNNNIGDVKVDSLSFLSTILPNDCTKSLYTYISILDQIANDKHTIANVLSLVSEEFNIGSERSLLAMPRYILVFSLSK